MPQGIKFSINPELQWLMTLKKPKTTTHITEVKNSSANHSDVWQQQLKDFHEIKGLSEWCRCADRSRLARSSAVTKQLKEQTEKTESDVAVYWAAFYIVVY